MEKDIETNPGIEAGAKWLYEFDGGVCWETTEEKYREIWRAAFLRALDVAFATGAVGLYTKAQGEPKPVDERIMMWLKAVVQHVDMIVRPHEAVISKRALLALLYKLSDEAKSANSHGLKNNAG